MDLNWGFFYDSWLIDPLPETLEVHVEESSNPKEESGTSVEINPKSLRCYFGANPEYVYGEGKFQHEVFLSPSGIAVIPKSNKIINDDIIKIKSIQLSFDESTDFNGNSNEEKHFGHVDPTEYIKNIQRKIYSVEDAEFSTMLTPTSNLRKATASEVSIEATMFNEYQIYENAQAMLNDGVKAYWKMTVDSNDTVNPYCSNYHIYCHSGKRVKTIRYGYEDIRDLEYTYGTLQSTLFNSGLRTDMTIFFTTLPMFRFGKLFSFGESDTKGFSMSIDNSSITIVMKLDASNITTITKPAIVDWGVSHKVQAGFLNGIATVLIDDYLVIREALLHTIEYDMQGGFYVGGEKKYGSVVPTGAGNITELVISETELNDTANKTYFEQDIPFLRNPNIPGVDALTVKPILPYDLTYEDGKELFIPNYRQEPIYEIYNESYDGTVEIFNRSSNIAPYRNDMTLSRDSEFKYPNKTRFTQMHVEDELSRDMKVLTKLTSDTHEPIRIDLEFEIPKWEDRKNKYFFSLDVMSLGKFLNYRFKTNRDT